MRSHSLAPEFKEFGFDLAVPKKEGALRLHIVNRGP
jgi:hypothetical protein